MIEFVKKNVVFDAAWLLAFVSMFFCAPNPEYFEYINFNVIILLFCMMIVVEGFSKMGLFKSFAEFILKKILNARALTLCFVLLCFFLSMLITNDVALITFVPFSIMVLKMAGLEKNLLLTIILETIAANLGSMMTPIGNPQNLYLYSVSGIDIIDFFCIIAPYTAVSFIILLISSLFVKKENFNASFGNKEIASSGFVKIYNKNISLRTIKLYTYSILFILCILSVLRIFNYNLLLIIVCISFLILDKKLFCNVDYILLLTFVGFFIFVGNMGKIQAIKDLVEFLFLGNEVVVSIGLSQVISNVPAALLLSGFTEKYPDLIIGVNIGGLGTLIASMASLISYKFYMKTENCSGKKYFFVFTVTNCVFLLILILTYYLI